MPKQDLSEYLAFLLASANRQMRIGLANSIDNEDCTEEHWRILHVLSDEQGRSMGELAEQVLMNGSALSKNMDKLVSRGLAQRAVDGKDNRKVMVFISNRGLKTVARLKRQVNAHHDSVTETFGSGRTKQLKALLESFISHSAPH